jgi:hypothetical protein
MHAPSIFKQMLEGSKDDKGTPARFLYRGPEFLTKYKKTDLMYKMKLSDPIRSQTTTDIRKFSVYIISFCFFIVNCVFVSPPAAHSIVVNDR